MSLQTYIDHFKFIWVSSKKKWHRHFWLRLLTIFKPGRIGRRGVSAVRWVFGTAKKPYVLERGGGHKDPGSPNQRCRLATLMILMGPDVGGE